MLRIKPDLMMGRARHQGLLIHFSILLLLGCTSAQQNSLQPSNFWYSNTHVPGLDVPFANDTVLIFGPETGQASGLTHNGTALCLTQPIPKPNETTRNPDAAGRGLARIPVQVRDPVTNTLKDWNTMFSFWIQSDSSYLPGQGLAFIMSPDNTSTGQAGSYLGWLNSTTNGQSLGNFAVEFDTVQNAEFNDLDENHIGVNVNSLQSECTETAGFHKKGKFITIKLTTTDEIRIYVWITYNATTTDLSVTISPVRARPVRPLLTCQVDLSPVLKQNMYVGFSASTGKDSTGVHMSQHSVYEWSFSSYGSAKNLFGNDTIPDKAIVDIIPIVIGVAGGAGLILLLLIVGVAIYIRKYSHHSSAFQVSEMGILDSVRGPQAFSHKELSSATMSFNEKNLLGRGGFGKVYKGVLLKCGVTMAVKRISKTSTQGAQEFVSEVKVIGRVRHRNLVPLLGWCHERGELLLVYEFMPNGSLDTLLFKEASEVLSWERRVKILSGVGAALAFLHEEWEQRVVHRDVKASNVMLDKDFNARLGDFGLARLYDHSQAPNSTVHLAGTVGYMAPELFNNGKATEKTDVYSFGALVLEIASGVQASSTPDNSKCLVDWVWRLHGENRILEAADSRLKGAFDPDEMTIVLQVGLLCSHPEADARPNVRKSLAMLKREAPVPMLPVMKPLPQFAFSMNRSESILFSNSTTRQGDFDDISLYSPNTKSTVATWSSKSLASDHAFDSRR